MVERPHSIRGGPGSIPGQCSSIFGIWREVLGRNVYITSQYFFPAIIYRDIIYALQGGSDISGTLSKLHCHIKKLLFWKILLPQTVPAVCQSINKNKKTHSSKDKSTGSYKSRDSLQTLRRTYHERDAELAQGDHTEVWVEEVWLPSSPDCKPFDYFVCGVSELWVKLKAKSGNKSNDLITC